ncbi:MAG: SIMPL domain-containing protein [Minisyncoccia bacterium]
MDQFFNNLNDVQKKRFFNAIVFTIALLAFFLGVKSLNTIKEYSYIGNGQYPSNVISVTGKGDVMTVPDTGLFSYSVVEEGKTVGIAQDKAAKKSNEIISALKTIGVEEKDIKTTGYNSYPKYDYSAYPICVNGYCPPSKQVLTGYEVNVTITVKVRKTADAGVALTKVGDLGASNISGLTFVVDDPDKAQAEARDEAIQDAKAKAKMLSKSLGVRLKRIINFYESGNQPVPYYGGAMMEVKAMGGDMAPTPPQLPVGENEVVSNVTITYEVE